MAYHVSTMTMRQKLGDMINRVSLRHDYFIIERKGKPLAAMVPVEKLEQMEKAARFYLLDVLERQKGSLPSAKADHLANLAKHKSRTQSRKK